MLNYDIMKNGLKLLLLLLFYSCGSSKSYVDSSTLNEHKVYEDKNFSFNYPSTWKSVEHESNSLGVVANVVPERASTRDGLLVFKTHIGTASLQEYFKAVSSVQETLSNTLMKREVTLVRHHENYYSEKGVIRPNKALNVKLPTQEVINHYSKNGEYLYKIHFSFKEGRSRKYLADMEMILKSFTFKDGNLFKKP